MSLYKDFRGLPDDQKLEAKMALMQAMCTVKHGRGRIPPETQVPPEQLLVHAVKYHRI